MSYRKRLKVREGFIQFTLIFEPCQELKTNQKKVKKRSKKNPSKNGWGSIHRPLGNKNDALDHSTMPLPGLNKNSKKWREFRIGCFFQSDVDNLSGLIGAPFFY